MCVEEQLSNCVSSLDIHFRLSAPDRHTPYLINTQECGGDDAIVAVWQELGRETC